jgi:hypothetical protein
MHSGLNHWSLVAVISHWGRVQRLLGAASERFAVWLVTDEPVHAVASRLKEPGHNERKVAMSGGKGRELHRSAGRLWDLFRQERRDAPIRYVRSKLHPLCDCLFGS